MTQLSKLNEYEQALANAETHYRTHFPCRAGHYKRYTKSKQCQPCHAIAVKRGRENGQFTGTQAGPSANPKTHITTDQPCKHCGGNVYYKRRPKMCVSCQQKRAMEWLHPEKLAADSDNSQKSKEYSYFLTKSKTYAAS